MELAQVGSHREEVEALDFLNTAADTLEVPVPQDLVAVGHIDADCLNARLVWSVSDAGNVRLFGGLGDGAKLLNKC